MNDKEYTFVREGVVAKLLPVEIDVNELRNDIEGLTRSRDLALDGVRRYQADADSYDKQIAEKQAKLDSIYRDVPEVK